MITYNLPRRIRYIPASAIFTATLGTPTAGKYDFAGKSQVFIAALEKNSVYLIDSISIAGNVSSENYLSSLETIPLFNLQKTVANENIFDSPLQMHSFATDRQIVHFFKTGANNVGLQASITGVLKQIDEFIGISSIQLSVNLSIHAIDDSDFEKTFRKES